MRILALLLLCAVPLLLACGPIAMGADDSSPDTGDDTGPPPAERYLPVAGDWTFDPSGQDDPCKLFAASPYPWTMEVSRVSDSAFTLALDRCTHDGVTYACEPSEGTVEAGDWGLYATVTYENWYEGKLTSDTTLEHIEVVNYVACEGEDCASIGPPIPCRAEFRADAEAGGR